MNGEESRHLGASPGASQPQSTQHLEARITELENRLKQLQQPQSAQLSHEDIQTYMKVRDALGIDPSGCLSECTRCIRCISCLRCISCSHCIQPCIYECTCGPCIAAGGLAGGGLRFGGLGGGGLEGGGLAGGGGGFGGD